MKNKNNIIVLTAVKESGKTTVFNLIKKNAEHFGIKTSEVSEMMLAGKLKDVCSLVFNLPRDLMDDASKNSDGMFVREVPFETPIKLTHTHLQRIVSQFGFEEIPQNTIKHLKEEIIHVRQLLQYVGTEVLRDYDENVHCNYIVKEIKKNKSAKLFVITDCRFHNEFDCFGNNSFTTAIVRDEKISASKKRIERGVEHRSEISVPELIERCKFKIDNNGNLAHLEKNVIEFLKAIKG